MSQLFGSWNAGLHRAGHRVTQTGLKRSSTRAQRASPGDRVAAWDLAEVLDALRDQAERDGSPPRYEDWVSADATGQRPTTPTVLALAESWNAALELAGLPVRRDQPGRRVPAGAREAAVAHYAAGESSTALAAEVGCHPSVILKWVRAAGGSVRPRGPRGPYRKRS